jgi:hypothetical protein
LLNTSHKILKIAKEFSVPALWMILGSGMPSTKLLQKYGLFGAAGVHASFILVGYAVAAQKRRTSDDRVPAPQHVGGGVTSSLSATVPAQEKSDSVVVH